MGEIPPSGMYYGQPLNPAARATRWTLLLGPVLAIVVLVWIGVHWTGTRPSRAAATPCAAKPVQTAHLVELPEPLQSLHPVRAVVRKETPRPRPVTRVDHVRPKPRHTVHVKAAKKPRTPVNALCARQFPHDLRLRSACVLFLS
jgi:hypothetical protein